VSRCAYVFLLFLGTVLFSQHVLAAIFAGTVIAVMDGDTILLKPAAGKTVPRPFLKIRLADIDAPEKDQAFGDDSGRALAALVLKKQVQVVTVASDDYGRQVARVSLGNLDVNRHMVQRGLAWAYTRYRRNPGLVALQREARRDRRGLWSQAEPVPPWVWRKQAGRDAISPASASK
jgi:endonuclease YncB( thermonuclease family)